MSANVSKSGVGSPPARVEVSRFASGGVGHGGEVVDLVGAGGVTRDEHAGAIRAHRKGEGQVVEFPRAVVPTAPALRSRRRVVGNREVVRGCAAEIAGLSGRVYRGPVRAHRKGVGYVIAVHGSGV